MSTTMSVLFYARNQWQTIRVNVRSTCELQSLVNVTKSVQDDLFLKKTGRRIGQEFSPLTFERYTTSKKHTFEFLKWKYKVDDIDIKRLNYEIHSQL